MSCSARRVLLRFTIVLIAAFGAAACATSEAPGSGDDDREIGSGDGGTDTTGPGPDAEPGSSSSDPCDLHEQTGCPDPDACDIEFVDFEEGQFTDQLACRGVAIPGREQSTCNGAEECAAGYQCISGHCRAYCQDDDDCPGDGGACTLTRSGSERNDDLLCTKDCAPDFDSEHENCPGGYSCYIRFVGPDDDRRAVTDCFETGPAGLGDDCEDRRCGAGLTCQGFVDGDGNVVRRSCVDRCRVDDQTCPSGDACRGFSTPTLVGNTEYGVCPE